MQSCHRQPSRVHAQPAGMLHGDPQWLRHWRQPRNGTSACGWSVDADHLHAQQVWRLWHCGERLLCAQRGNETHSVDRRIWVSVIQICKQNSNLPHLFGTKSLAPRCPVDDKLISRFRGTWSDTGVYETQVYAYMKTFRFTGSPALYIECDVRMCHGRCPVSCVACVYVNKCKLTIRSIVTEPTLPLAQHQVGGQARSVEPDAWNWRHSRHAQHAKHRSDTAIKWYQRWCSIGQYQPVPVAARAAGGRGRRQWQGYR